MKKLKLLLVAICIVPLAFMLVACGGKAPTCNHAEALAPFIPTDGEYFINESHVMTITGKRVLLPFLLESEIHKIVVLAIMMPPTQEKVEQIEQIDFSVGFEMKGSAMAGVSMMVILDVENEAERMVNAIFEIMDKSPAFSSEEINDHRIGATQKIVSLFSAVSVFFIDEEFCLFIDALSAIK